MSDNWTRTGDWRVLDRPEYVFEVEEYRDGAAQMIFVHIHVFEWTKQILKQLLHEFRVFRECTANVPVFCVGVQDDEKFFAWVSMFGFKPFSEVVCENGERRRLFIHVKDNKHVDEGQHHPVGRNDQYDNEPVVSAGAVSDAGVQRSV